MRNTHLENPLDARLYPEYQIGTLVVGGKPPLRSVGRVLATPFPQPNPKNTKSLPSEAPDNAVPSPFWSTYRENTTPLHIKTIRKATAASSKTFLYPIPSTVNCHSRNGCPWVRFPRSLRAAFISSSLLRVQIPAGIRSSSLLPSHRYRWTKESTNLRIRAFRPLIRLQNVPQTCPTIDAAAPNIPIFRHTHLERTLRSASLIVVDGLSATFRITTVS